MEPYPDISWKLIIVNVFFPEFPNVIPTKLHSDYEKEENFIGREKKKVYKCVIDMYNWHQHD